MAFLKEEKELKNNMDYVYLLQATEEQYQKMMKFLDVVIKKEGLDVIQDVVDVYNVLVSGRKVPLSLPEPEQPAQKLVEELPIPTETPGE
jgi:hypothetical protein